jgi:hypothetical protein
VKSKLEIYALAVCFCCIGCLIISGSIAAQSLLRASFPEMMVSGSEYSTHQTNDDYLMIYADVKQKKLPDGEITKLREASLQRLIVQQRRDGFQSLLTALIFVISAASALWVHWRIAKRARA